MPRRRWKTYQPNSLRDALEGCKVFARDQHNLSVERIAEQMGLVDHWALYKWLQNGRFPTNLLIPYERVCGINLVSRWLAANGGRLLVEIPTGRQATAEDIQELQSRLHEVTGLLMRFYQGSRNAEETLAGVQCAMEQLAWHRGNVQQHQQPQFDLE